MAFLPFSIETRISKSEDSVYENGEKAHPSFPASVSVHRLQLVLIHAFYQVYQRTCSLPRVLYSLEIASTRRIGLPRRLELFVGQTTRSNIVFERLRTSPFGVRF